VFSRKYTMIGRLVTRWEDIVGKELAGKTHPAKIHYYKSRKAGVKATASLDISANGADATLLHYQKDLILERINQIFGDSWITAIRFVPTVSNTSSSTIKNHKVLKALTREEKEHLSDMLEEIEDTELLARLRSLGVAILQDKNAPL